MRLLESILLAVVAATLLSTLALGQKRPRPTFGLCALGALIALLQAALEGVRWQLVPAHVVLIVATATSLRSLRRPAEDARDRRPWPRLLAITLGLLVVASSAALAFVLPVFSLESPTGPHAVGVSTFEWVDPSRPEARSTDPSARRALVVELWYPATHPPGAEPARYLDPRVAAGIAGGLRLPGFVLGHLALVSTHSVPEAPLAPGAAPFPVLLFSHGLRMHAGLSKFQAEELASHGYVVVGINHTYDAAFAQFRNGTSVPFDAWGDLGSQKDMDRYISQRIPVWVEDARFVLDRLAALKDEDPRFAGRLDLTRVGYFGHSMGGAAALAALAADPRFQAGLNLDGALFGVSADARPSQPFMLVTGENLKATDRQLQQMGMTRADFEAFVADMQQRWERSTSEAPGPRYRLEMQEAGHMELSDASLILTLMPGSMPPRRAHRVVNDYTLAFFDAHLKGAASPLLKGPAVEPTVKFTAFSR